MISKEEIIKARRKTLEYFSKANIVITEEELENIEVTDFGLGNLKKIGLQLVIYINTPRVCAKEMVLFPYQICPQHKHPDVNNLLGKEETFRCRMGEVYLYLPDGKTKNIKGRIPDEHKDCFSIFREVILKPGDQYTIYPDTWHWFQAGKEGAIVSEFSTHSSDETDIFYDKNVKRV